MDTYAKLFTKAGLVYLLIGVILGVAIGFEPAWNVRLRFVHIHLNLLGFMVMMIAGVAYHVLPRFNARPIPWPEGVKYHFIFHNVGLIGMVLSHLAGGPLAGGAVKIAFVVFSMMAAVGLFIMVYNLLGVMLVSEPKDKPKSVTKDMKVSTVLEHFPQSMPVFLQSGFKALANPVARQSFAKVVTIEKACEKHGVDADEFIQKLNAALFGESSAKVEAETKEKAAVGTSIKKGELCQSDVMVGSLIKIYPETKPVFEKHYGEGCFSCPGQVVETVEQTANMHNIDPSIILKEINVVITQVLGEKK